MFTEQFIYIVTVAAATTAFAQGTFVFDQQSSTDETGPGYRAGSLIQSLLPSTGQSFTPGLSGIDFIRLKFDDGGGGGTASIYLNLRSGSITGTILGTTAPVSLPTGFNGPATFLFPNTVLLTPYTPYYFELVLQSGANWYVDVASYSYSGGEAFARGAPAPGADYWFREGLYMVPEPSAGLLGILGLGLAALVRGRRGI